MIKPLTYARTGINQVNLLTQRTIYVFPSLIKKAAIFDTGTDSRPMTSNLATKNRTEVLSGINMITCLSHKIPSTFKSLNIFFLLRNKLRLL